MKITLWIIQGLLALAFVMAGGMKTFTSIDQLALSLPWVAHVPAALVRFIGISEIAGALGLILPQLTGIQPKLTVWAAWALVLVMILGAGHHIMQGEYAVIMVNVVLAALCGFVAIMRNKA